MKVAVGCRETFLDDDGQKCAVAEVETGDVSTQLGGFGGVLVGDKMLSIADSPEDLAAVISRSNKSELVKAAIAEIRSKRTPLTVKQWSGYLTLFAMVLGLGAFLWPKPYLPPTVSDDTSDITLWPERYETKEVLESKLSGSAWESSLKKLRTIMIEHTDTNSYRRDYTNYLGAIQEVRNEHPGEQLPKRCYVEAVLRCLNGSEKIGLKTYAEKLKKEGDKEYLGKKVWISRAIECCNEMERGQNPKTKLSEDRLINVKFQRAQLLMFQWLVRNAENCKAKGKGNVSRFPDDEGGLGVSDREEAIDIIARAKKKADGAEELVGQCVRILTDDWDWGFLNRAYFNGKPCSKDDLKKQKSEVLKIVKE